MTTNILLSAIVIAAAGGGSSVGFEAQTQHCAALRTCESSLIEIVHIHSSIYLFFQMFSEPVS